MPQLNAYSGHGALTGVSAKGTLSLKWGVGALGKAMDKLTDIIGFLGICLSKPHRLAVGMANEIISLTKMVPKNYKYKYTMQNAK